MASIKKLLTNRILISLLVSLTLACAFEFYFHPFVGPLYRSGLQAYNSANYALSVRRLREAAKYEPNNPAILTLLGWALLKMGKPALAEPRFRAAHRLSPHDPELQLGLAYAEIGLDRPGQAGRILNEIRKERPGWIETPVAQGILYRREGLAKLAVMEFRLALSLAPHNAKVLKNLREIRAESPTLPLINTNGLLHGLVYPVGAVSPPAPQNPAVADKDLTFARTLGSRQEFPEAIAQYKAYLASHPRSAAVFYELGELLLKADEPQEAVPVFRRILSIDPEDAGGTLGLAESLAATGQFQEALLHYHQFLKTSPRNYEARQGLASALLRTGRSSAAKPIFEGLANEDPGDPVNHRALKIIATAKEKDHWESLQPLPGSPPAEFVQYDEAYLTTHPGHHSTLVELAANQTKLNDIAGAISTYRLIINLYPSDEDSELRLAQELAWSKHYSEAIQVYQDLLRTSPGDSTLLQKLAQIELWANRLQDALHFDQRLLKQQPGNAELMIRIASLEQRLKDYPEAREAYATLATIQPGNRGAGLGLATLDEKRGNWTGARREYQRVLAYHSHDPTALYGDARLAYYQGDFVDALNQTEKLIQEEPGNTDALLLMARIENARGRRRLAKSLVARAEQADPEDPEVSQMRQTLSQEPAITIHTSSSYAREVGSPLVFFTPQNVLITGPPSEDLNAYSNSATIGFRIFPRSQSYISVASMPSNSPSPGPGIGGAVAPLEFQYRQSTDLASFLTVRGGIGFERLGPARSVIVPSQSIVFPNRSTSVPVTAVIPAGYAGFSVRPTRQLSFDFAISRDGVAYTPLSVRFGVTQVRKLAGLRYKPDRRDQVHITYYHDNFNSSLFDRISKFNGGTVTLSPNGLDQAKGGTFDYDRTLIQSEAFTLGVGYSGEAFGYTGQNRGVYMGFFNPTFYQRHFATANSKGHIWGPLSYAFTGGYGLQQLGDKQPFTPAYQTNPSLGIRVNSRFSVSLGYIHYNFGQSLGRLTGNAVQISTDSKF